MRNFFITLVPVIVAAVSAASLKSDVSITDFNTVLWALIVGSILAFVLGFGMGANDVSNAFGTSVGSKALSLRNAYILASIFETLGAVLVGYNVADTMRKEVVDISLYINEPEQLIFGQVAILGGCSTWLLIATFAELPVSTTQSVVGATVGFSIALKGFMGIKWKAILKIILSWFLSPVLSGIISVILYIIVDFAVLRRQFPLESGLRILPIFYFACIAFNTFAVSYQGSKILSLSSVPLWFAIVLSITLGLISSFIVHYVVKPRLLTWIHRRNTIIVKCESVKSRQINVVVPLPDLNQRTIYNSTLYTVEENSDKNFINSKLRSESKLPVNSTENIHYKVNNHSIKPTEKNDQRSASVCFPVNLRESKNSNYNDIINGGIRLDDKYIPQKFEWSFNGFFHWLLPARQRQEDKKTLRLFCSIQVFTACFAGFAHGANDVSNAIAPLTALISIYTDRDVMQNSQTPIYVLLYGVLAICIGLCTLGHKVIKTVGQKMSEIHPASGFTIEFGAAVTTLIASKVGLPISTTHCLIGSVVAVGSIKPGDGIRWSIFRNVVFSWIVTLPITALLSAVLMLIIKTIFL